MTDNKIEIIEQLSTEKVIDLITILLSKLGYVEVKTGKQWVNGKLKNPLSTSEHNFVIYEERLSGNISAEELYKFFNELLAKSLTNQTFVISQYHISNGFKTSFHKLSTTTNVEFIDRDSLIRLIDEKFTDYWKHDDSKLLEYERSFCKNIIGDSEIKKLKIFNDKYEKLLDFFVEPNIIYIYEDKDSKTLIRKRIGLDEIATTLTPQIISGNTGYGKTTLLKRLGKTIINKNQGLIKKILPIFISVEEIFAKEYDLELVINESLAPYYNNDIFYKDYSVTLLIDTIDELEAEHQKKVLNKLEQLWKDKKVSYVIGTRNSEKIISHSIASNVKNYRIEKFNFDQIKKFVGLFFNDKPNRSEELLEALRENRIIDKLPITPLTLSLLSILYEENNLEIPATITDIYDNFNSLLLGKAIVSTRLEFIDISFKERILSLYAIELLKRREHQPMTKGEFYSYFDEYFKNKTIPLKKGSLKDVIEDIFENTGILLIKHNTYVHFSHNSFMEYYASLEIFKHQRNLEFLYVDNFFEANWQNSAVFYAGKSKDMPDLLLKITDKLNLSSKHSEFIMGVFGMGYLLQALYQTDNIIRKDAILAAIDCNIKFHEVLVKLASDEAFMFKNFTLPTLWVMNVIYFYESFNSMTLKAPLKECFKTLYQEYLNSKPSLAGVADTTKGYKALKVAMTLNSKRINESTELEQMIFESDLTNDPILSVLTNLSLDIYCNGRNNFKQLKKALKKEQFRFKEPIKTITQVPASRLRFSNIDQIKLERKYKLITEGPSDVEILTHAFSVLTDGDLPYWSISASGNKSGSSHEVNKSLIQAKAILNIDEILIGIFDRDSAGLMDFHKLPANIFFDIKSNIIRKHHESEIYAVCLPVPFDRENYLKKEQNFNFFELEHYFYDDLLISQNMVVENSLPGIFSIKDKAKAEFSKFVRKQLDPAVFKRFIELFRVIDEITGIEVEYIDEP